LKANASHTDTTKKYISNPGNFESTFSTLCVKLSPGQTFFHGELEFGRIRKGLTHPLVLMFKNNNFVAQTMPIK
jgi:hypothetical protein